MDQTITEKLAALNEADLSALAKRIAALKAEYEKALAAKGANPNATATDSDISDAAGKAGISTDDLLSALEAAKRRGLI